MEKSDKILVTGGRGLVGSAVVAHLTQLGYSDIVPIGREDCDLMDRSATEAFLTR